MGVCAYMPHIKCYIRICAMAERSGGVRIWGTCGQMDSMLTVLRLDEVQKLWRQLVAELAESLLKLLSID